MDNFSILTGAMIQLTSPFRLIHVIKRLPDFQLRPHSHHFFHIIFVTSGILEVSIKGNTHAVSENQAIILPPYIPHALSSKYGYCQIGVDIFDTENNELCSLLNQTFPSGFGIVKMQLLPAHFEEMIKSVRDLTKLNRLKLQNNAEALVISFIEQASDTSNKSFRDRFLDMIAHDDGLNFTLPDMCSYLNISKTHLERLVHDEFECSAVEYYNKLKLMKACFLLQNSESSIRNISEKLGFYDESHFTRFFKKNMGVTPSNYRNNSRTPL